ncbi:molybdopterin-synthase adenylyltransferase MoeB [Corynebacterium sp. H128]|uniref:molybdopterin-synthase adenylyltransferase MoeB n=1 Tax=Corynebacterium sp. H128 TaxID=3133427 RepID=UPI00309C4818
MSNSLSGAERSRYARHLTLPGVGEEGQLKLKQARVLVIGAGGLGSPILNYLGAAGVGHITVIDDDLVEESNLQRQTIHRMADIGRPKVDSARDALARLNPFIKVTPLRERLTPDNALALFRDHDLAIDGTDNFATRYLSNDAAEITGTPLVWGTISQFQGQLSIFDPNAGPMLRDLFPDIPPADAIPSCAVGGIFGALAGMIGAMLAIEALKLITGVGRPAVGKLLLVDALQASTRELSFERDPARVPPRTLTHLREVCATATPAPTTPEPRGTLIDVRTPEETAAGTIPGALLVPLVDIEERGWAALSDIPGDTLTLYCQSGIRSERAIKLVERETKKHLLSLQGGFVAWRAQHGATS